MLHRVLRKVIIIAYLSEVASLKDDAIELKR
jgi:hypothetical protein